MANKQATKFLIDLEVFNEQELLSRRVVNQENYLNKVLIESQTMTEMATESIIPAVEQHFLLCCDIAKNMSQESSTGAYKSRKDKIETCLSGLIQSSEKLGEISNEIESKESLEGQIDLVEEKLKDQMGVLRGFCDQAEQLVSADLWALPKYREMLFHPSLASG